MSAASLRLDKALWYLRLAKTRALAQQRIAEGHVRINGRRAERSAQPVAAGDVLTLPLGARVAVVELLALPTRRGPAPEAQACYRALDASPELAIAPRETAPARGTPSP
ncbi:MAG: RNA-binding S4 domain-containing protein [Novosphingobium sp.]|nr:RNA-binding S4 domain-containing protein [Novosphingobium sp.]